MNQVEAIVGELGLSVFVAAGAIAEGGSEPDSSSGSGANASVLDQPVDSETTSGILESWSLAVVRMLCSENSKGGSGDLLRPDLAVAAAVVAECTLQATMATLSDDGDGALLADTDLQERLEQWEVVLEFDLPRKLPGPENIPEHLRAFSRLLEGKDPPQELAVPLPVAYHVFESMTTALKAFRVVVDAAAARGVSGVNATEVDAYRDDIQWLSKHWHWAFECATGLPADVMYEIAALKTFPWETDSDAWATIRRASPSTANSISTVRDGGAAQSDSKRPQKPDGADGSDAGAGWTAADVAEAVGAEKEKENARGEGTGSAQTGTSVPVWMQALSREQVCEYFVKQRDEFARVREMLMDRELARKAAEDQFGSLDQATVPGEAAQYADPNVVWEQQEVLADVQHNMELLYTQVSARLEVCPDLQARGYPALMQK